MAGPLFTVFMLISGPWWLNELGSWITQGSYMNIRGRGFIDSWSKIFDGLQDSSDGIICTYCKKFPNIAGPWTESEILSRHLREYDLFINTGD
jgi:hypothetical protein